MENVNWEKMGVYLAALGMLFMIWNFQNSIKDEICLVRERLSSLEAKVSHLEGSK